MSYAICSNVPGFEEPICMVSDGDPQKLVDSMVDQLEEIAVTAFELLQEDFAYAYMQIDTLPEDGIASKSSDALRDVLDNYLMQLPVVGFNSGRYDINVIKPYLFSRLERDLQFVIKNRNEYKCVATEQLRFLDILQYLAPGYSYATYLKAYDIQETKGFFPYEFVTDLSKLEYERLPPQEAFYSSLKKQGISDTDYAYCQQQWTDCNMKTVRDLLVWYNSRDVQPFLAALEKQIEFYRGLGLDMLKDSVGIPGLTLRYMFKILPRDAYFGLLGEKHKDLHNVIRANLTGGPSIVFSREQIRGETLIRNKYDPVQCVEGYDANSLYLWALSQNMPTRHGIRRRKANGFKAEPINRRDEMSRQWLAWMEKKHSITLTHKFNSGERRLGKRGIPVDGWCEETKTAYNFHGCIHHGHPNCPLTRGRKRHPLSHKPLSKLHRNTQKIRKYLTDTVQVTVVEMYECQWLAMTKNVREVKRFLHRTFPVRKPFKSVAAINTDTIVQAVLDKTLFGLVYCDLHVPDDLKTRFKDFPPIFKNTDVTIDDIGPHMREYAEREGLMKTPRRTLISSFWAKNILLATPLLHWYLEHGLVVTAVHEIVEYSPQPVFEAFADKVSESRRTGDEHPDKAILGNTYKTIGNSSYGRTLTNVLRHTDVCYCSSKDDVSAGVNNPLFVKMEHLTEDLVEIETHKQTVWWALPTIIGFFVYQEAKKRMLQFFYDFLRTFVSHTKYALCEMDTDSLYFALSEPSLAEAVRESKRREFYETYHHWFPSPVCDDHRDRFVRRSLKRKAVPIADCCAKRAKFDKRTPGLFKLEFKGDKMICLCPKTYIIEGQDRTKFSSKGLSTKQNKFQTADYSRVLANEQSGTGTNTSFKMLRGKMHTYRQRRAGLSYLYIKRRVRSDGVSTKPLLI